MGLFTLAAAIYGVMCLVDFTRARPAATAAATPARSARFARWRREHGDPLGPRPTGDLADTRVALVAGAFVWWCLRSLAATLVAGSDARRLCGIPLDVVLTTTINLAVSIALLRAATSGKRRSELKPGKLVSIGVRGGFGAFAVSLCIGLVILAAYTVLGREPPSQAIVEEAKRAQGLELLILVLAAVLIAPIAEEIFFRGILLPAASLVAGERVGLLAQAAVFGAVHVVFAPETWPLAVPLAAVGWLSGWIYLRTGSLAISIVLHATFNALNFAALLAS